MYRPGPSRVSLSTLIVTAQAFYTTELPYSKARYTETSVQCHYTALAVLVLVHKYTSSSKNKVI